MKPEVAIEFALRLKGTRLSVREILDFAEDLINEAGVDEAHLLRTATSESARFLVRENTIALLPERAADRVGFFRERLLGIRQALRLTPFVQNTVVLELAIVYALAVRGKGVAPTLEEEHGGLWPILDQLAREFPPLERELKVGLKDAMVLARYRIQTELLLTTCVGLTPTECVQEMRAIVSGIGPMGQFCIPWSVGELMTRLLGTDIKEVFDPSADASVLPIVSAFNPSAHAEAVFVNRFGQFFGTLQARVLGASWSSCLNEEFDPMSKKTYAHCISAPPFGGRAKGAGALRAVTSHEIAINQTVKRLAPGGRAVVLVAESMVFSEGENELRDRLVREGLLSAVISLPGGLFRPSTSIKTSILLIERSAPDREVTFIDAAAYASLGPKRQMTLDVAALMLHVETNATELPICRIAREEVLRDEQITLSAARWLGANSKESMVDGSDDSIVPLGELVSVAQGMAAVKEDLPYFQVAELASDVMDLVRTAKHGRMDRPASATNARMLNQPAVLVARVGGTLKPTLFDPVDGPIALGTNVVALIVNAKRVDPQYLALELRSGAVQEQVNSYVVGSSAPYLSSADMLRLLIRVPERAEQLRIVAEQLDLGQFMEGLKRSGRPMGSDLEHFSKLLTKNISRLGVSGMSKVLTDWMQHENALAVKAMIDTATENMHMLQHQFNNRLSWVTNGLSNVDAFVDMLVRDGIIPRDMPVAPTLDGEETPAPSIHASLTQLRHNAEHLPELFDRLAASINWGDLRTEQVELEEFLQTDILPLYQNDARFKVNLDGPTGRSTMAYIDRFAMKQVLTNIIDNAVKHGFTEPDKKYNIYIDIDDRYLLIANDGIPPSISLEEMKIRRRSVGPNAGSGEGMYWADVLMQRMGGRLTQAYGIENYLQAPVSFAIMIDLPATT